MTLKQDITRWVVSQFHDPRGIGGHAAGWIMGHRRSNIERNEWVVSLLDVQPTDRVLEVGCGPGIALRALARRTTAVYGVDRSPVMVQQARRRNRGAGLDIRVAAAEELPEFDQPFDRIMSV